MVYVIRHQLFILLLFFSIALSIGVNGTDLLRSRKVEQLIGEMFLEDPEPSTEKELIIMVESYGQEMLLENKLALHPNFKTKKGLIMLVDFYLPWCPHCKQFSPVWSTVANSFSNSSKIVRFGSLDCVSYKTTCKKVGIDRFPLVRPFLINEAGFLVPPLDFRTKESPKTVGKTNLTRMKNWVKTALFHYGLEVYPLNISMKKILSKTSVPVTKVRDEDLSTTLHYALWNGVFIKNNTLAGSRALAMKTWLKTIMKSFPGNTYTQLDTLVLLLNSSLGYPTKSTWAKHLLSLTVFGRSLGKSRNWDVCGGKYHQFPCGLWQLFHTIVARAPNNQGVNALHGVVTFVKNFFTCTPCQKHFLSMTKLFNDGTKVLSTNAQASLFLWEMHNRVSIRLSAKWGQSKEESIWPPAKKCPSCRITDKSSAMNKTKAGWNLKKVANYLQTIYG